MKKRILLEDLGNRECMKLAALIKETYFGKVKEEIAVGMKI